MYTSNNILCLKSHYIMRTITYMYFLVPFLHAPLFGVCPSPIANSLFGADECASFLLPLFYGSSVQLVSLLLQLSDSGHHQVVSHQAEAENSESVDLATDPLNISESNLETGDLKSESETRDDMLVTGGESQQPDLQGLGGVSGWEQPQGPSYMPCTGKEPDVPLETKGYLVVHSNGGLNQMRLGIADMVAISKVLGATLVVPFLDSESYWQDNR
jgi:hypothetical protein